MTQSKAQEYVEKLIMACCGNSIEYYDWEEVVEEYGSEEAACLAVSRAIKNSGDYRRFHRVTNTCMCGVCEWCLGELGDKICKFDITTIEDYVLLFAGEEVSPEEEEEGMRWLEGFVQ